MKKHLTPVIAVALAVSPTVLMANPMSQGDSYAGITYSQLTYDEDGISGDANPTALIGRLGYFVANQIAIEGRLGIGLSDDTVRIDGFGQALDVDLELDRLLGFYAVGHLPVGDAASIYGLFGFTDAKATASANGLSESDTDSGLSYGFGAEFNTSEQIGLNIEYTQYLDESGYDLSAISAGVKLHF